MAAADDFRKHFRELLMKAGDRADTVVRHTAQNMLSALIVRSPVGNPDLWKHKAPPGYVGGRFKNNWNFDLGAIDYRDNQPPDAGGTGAYERGLAKMQQFTKGDTIYITNSLPYANRIEYEGWSSQAPSGVVRLTVLEFADAVKKAVQESRQ
jgi:hypothetical protein